jgi:hypothetical protein
MLADNMCFVFFNLVLNPSIINNFAETSRPNPLIPFTPFRGV